MRDRREELRELLAAGNPFSPPQSCQQQQQPPATASYGSCQPSQSYGIRSAPPAASLYAYQAPYQTPCRATYQAPYQAPYQTLYQAPYQTPIILRRLCVNPSLRTRTVARVLFTHWASCSPYARLCRDPKLGSRLGLLIHWRKRAPGAFRRWRSWSRTRAVAFFGQQLGLALGRWRRLRARRAACDAWLRKRRLRQFARAMRVWRLGEAARVQRAQEARERGASNAEGILRHWRHCAIGRAWRAWAARIEARANAEQLLTSAGVRWRLTRGGAFAHWRATARALSVAWVGALRATRGWHAHGLSAAWRTWRWQAEASLRRLGTTAAAAAAVRRWRLRDAAVALEAWAAGTTRSRGMVKTPNKPRPRRDREGDWRDYGTTRWHTGFRALTHLRLS